MAQVSRSSALSTWISERASRSLDGKAVAALSVVMDVGHLSVVVVLVVVCFCLFLFPKKSGSYFFALVLLLRSTDSLLLFLIVLNIVN